MRPPYAAPLLVCFLLPGIGRAPTEPVVPLGAGSYTTELPPGAKAPPDAMLVKEKGGTNWTAWVDLIWMYRALDDPADAIKQVEAAGDRFPVEGGDSRANTIHWVYSLNKLGRVDASVTANYPLYAVFKKGKTRTYCIYNMTEGPRTAAFSDGFQLKAAGKGFAHATAGE